MSNPRIENEQLKEASYKWSQKQSKGKTVLAIQDTTEINYQKKAGRLSQEDMELGPVGNDSDIGFFLHPTLVIDVESCFPLGVSCIHDWNRDWKKRSKEERGYKNLAIEEKESYRWIESAQFSKEVLQEAQHLTIIGDRESDIYEELVEIPDEHCDLLIRSGRDRRLHDSEDHLFGFLSSLPLRGENCIEIKGHKKRKDRVAQLEIRYERVQLARPTNRRGSELPSYVELYAIEVREKESSVPEGEEPIVWRLLTTHEIRSVEEAWMYVRWYSYRWWIEELFRVLKKKGLQVEEAQYESGLALKRLVILCLQAALTIMQLKAAREGKYEVAPETVFEEQELEFQTQLLPELEGKTEKQKNPYPRTNLAWSAWIIARLGGWKGTYSKRASPGVLTMKRGLEAFYQMYRGWCLARASPL